MSYTKKNGEEILSLADHVWLVLLNNLKGDNHWLNESDIAIRVMSNVLGRPQDKTLYGKVIQPKSIKSCMGTVRSMADIEGMTIVAERKTEDDKGNDLKGWIITGWRIATEEDQDYIQHELELRAIRETGYADNRKRIHHTAKTSGLLPKESPQESIEE